MSLTIRAAGPLVVSSWLLAATLAHAETAPAQPASPDLMAPAAAPPASEIAPESAAPPASAAAAAPICDNFSVVAPASSGLQFTVTPYLWFPSIKSTVYLNPPGSRGTISANSDIGFGKLFSDLNVGFMGAGEVRYGRWSAQTDIIWLSVSQGGQRIRDVTGPFGRVHPTSLNTKLDQKTTIWTLSGGYDVFRNQRNFVEVFAGFRYLGMSNKLDWGFQGPIGDISRAGTVSSGGDMWDGIIGVRGESQLGDGPWKATYYGDIGTGGAMLTWQAQGMLAYAMRWGDLGVGWRYLDYQPGDGALNNLRITGPIIGGHFRFGG
jgi:hypothetical protein